MTTIHRLGFRRITWVQAVFKPQAARSNHYQIQSCLNQCLLVFRIIEPCNPMKSGSSSYQYLRDRSKHLRYLCASNGFDSLAR